jgi:MYXO-CTERM domain-containing protein
MRTYLGRRVAMIGFLAGSVGLLETRAAEACSPGLAPATTALPANTATNVSTATSLIVFAAGPPSGLTLSANGQNVPLSAAISLGNGVLGSGTAGSFWQLRAGTPDGMLVGGAEHVLSQAKSDGTTAELTRFTAATGYDKAEGTAPVLRGVRLWRVRYPVADIASGNCVFAEYHGFVSVDYDPATVPNTPPASVVHTFQLAPKTGGSAQTFVFAGAAPFAGREPTGTYPIPTHPWQPELDPTREYCLAIGAFGDGDIARLPLRSQSVCAEVVQLSAAGAPPPPTVGGAAGSGGGTAGSGGSTAGSGGSAGSTGGTAGGGGGCAVAGAASSAFAVWLLLVVVTAGARRRRAN